MYEQLKFFRISKVQYSSWFFAIIKILFAIHFSSLFLFYIITAQFFQSSIVIKYMSRLKLFRISKF
uniref:Putative ovule protein n=1 Tax=Solanum chacoense TaxID=4108 RepID=A0A0V0IJ71_SOLCH